VAALQFKITAYTIHLGERSQAAPGSGGKPLTVTGVLTCRGEAGEAIKIYFYRSVEPCGAVLPATAAGEEGKPLGLIWEPESSYAAFLDLIRNESPAWGYIDEKAKPPVVKICTGTWEPAGVGDEGFEG
jgi:hypothetical protein